MEDLIIGLNVRIEVKFLWFEQANRVAFCTDLVTYNFSNISWLVLPSGMGWDLLPGRVLLGLSFMAGPS